MRSGNLCAALTAAAIAFGACGDGSDLAPGAKLPDAPVPTGQPEAPAEVQEVYKRFLAGQMPAPSSGATTVEGRVELRQQKLDTNPPMGPCPNWGASPGQAWTQIFRYASPDSNTYPTGQPNNCTTMAPNSIYPNFWASSHNYPSGHHVNDEIRAFFSWVNPGNCVKVTLYENPPSWGYGASMAYQACGTSGIAYAWSGNVQNDAGFNIRVTAATVEWWTL